MKEIQDNTFHLIFCPEKLQEVIYFLEIGYGWDPQRSRNLLDRLKEQLPKFPAAAIYEDKGGIKIAVLLFYQGYNKNQLKDVINFSNWYAAETHRGMEAVIFAKNVTEALNELIITCYTPMEAVCKVLKLLKYKNMHVKKIMSGLSKKFPFIQLKFPIKFLTFKNFLIQPKNLEVNEIGMAASEWLYKVHPVKKFGLPCSVLSLFNQGGYSRVNIFWLIALMIRHGVVRVNLYLRADKEPPFDIWLIKNSDNELYISPVDSELVV